MTNHFTPTNTNPADLHQCTSHTDGDWTVWRCPHCPGYERQFNWVTSEMKVRSGGSTALHSGMADDENGMAALTEGLCQN
jgi:hypothetical protein